MFNEAGDRSERDSRSPPRKIGILTPLFAVSGVLLTFVLVYLGYDYVAMRGSPCEAIFKQASLGLSTKISFLKTEGEISIGREQLVELGERAQMTALNLKTCCTVLDAGRVNPEQFLQCKSKARAYDAKLEEIYTVVSQIASAPRSGSTGEVVATGRENAAPSMLAPEAKQQIAQTVEAARDISKDFNREIVEVRKAQTLETLKLEPPKEVTVSAQESEPNNDGMNTNAIPLEKWISASIGEANDADMYAFVTPPTHRDWIVIRLDNRSTTLEPRIELFNTDKVSLGSRHITTPGSNIDYRFVSEPGTRYLVRVSNYYGETTGGYLLEVRPSKAYDEYEPNGGILEARTISAGTEIEASIMDGKDRDFYSIEAPNGAKTLQVKLANTSTTLRPRIDIFGGDKVHLTHKHSTTGGADLLLSLPIDQAQTFRMQVSDYYGDAVGSYKMTVNFSE